MTDNVNREVLLFAVEFLSFPLIRFVHLNVKFITSDFIAAL